MCCTGLEKMGWKIRWQTSGLGVDRLPKLVNTIVGHAKKA